jgi:hypothetical protein
MPHSTASQRASEIGREQIEKDQQKRLAAALSGPFAVERAGLVLVIVAGFGSKMRAPSLPFRSRKRGLGSGKARFEAKNADLRGSGPDDPLNI